MQINNINNLGFKGQTKFLSCNSEGNHKKIAEYLYGSRVFGETRGLQDFVKKRSYPYASVEETIGKFHDDITYKVYIADPNEVVTNTIKQTHDYVVYDHEPTFPDVKNKYFSFEHGNLDKEFQTVYDYYERLENTANQTNVEETAKKQKELVNNCMNIFAESSSLREEQSRLTSKIRNKTELINIIESNAENYTKKLPIKKVTISRHKKSYNAKFNKIENWLDKIELLKAKDTIQWEEIESINEKINMLRDITESIDKKIKQYEEIVLYWENYIKNAPQKIAEYSSDITKMKSRLKELEQELRPNYEKLCNFYTQNGIKIIKRI